MIFLDKIYFHMLEYVENYLEHSGITASKYMVEVGAHHWERGSKSKNFIEAGWKAMLVEPHPYLYKELSEKYLDNPNVVCLDCAASNENGVGELYEGAEGREDGAHTMFDMEKYYGILNIIKIPITKRTLTEVFDEHDVPSDLAFLSIDTEGMDLEVLLGLDLDKYKPRVISTEDVSFNSHLIRAKVFKQNLNADKKNPRKRRHLIDNNYVQVGEDIDATYVLKK